MIVTAFLFIGLIHFPPLVPSLCRWSRQALRRPRCVLCYLRRGKMRVTPHLVRRLSSTHLLQGIRWRTVLDQPTCLSVAQVLPSTIIDACLLRHAPPSLGVDVLDQITRVGEDMLRMAALLAHQDCHSEVAEWDENGLTTLTSSSAQKS